MPVSIRDISRMTHQEQQLFPMPWVAWRYQPTQQTIPIQPYMQKQAAVQPNLQPSKVKPPTKKI